MKLVVAALVCVLPAVVAASGSLRASAITVAPTADVESNVCNAFWSYCPRDPGCVTYTMSVENVVLYAPGHSKPVDAESLQPGDVVSVIATGSTTLTSVPSTGSFKIYSYAGKNVGGGPLSNVLSIDAPHFELNVTFTLDANCFGSGSMLEFGIDVFQDPSGTDEAMCMEVYDLEYLDAERNKPDPPFETYCKDMGGGHFKKQNTPITGHAITSPSCKAPPSSCDLEWNICARDPGCATYDMLPVTVTVDVSDKAGVNPGDNLHVTVNGTTQLTSIPAQGSYRIYSLSGHNMGAGVLDGTLDLFNCETGNGCHFGLSVPVTVTDAAFDPTHGWFEFGIDVFREASGTLESMCVEVANSKYDTYRKTSTDNFDQYCVPDGDWGKWTKHEEPAVVHTAVCHLV